MIQSQRLIQPLHRPQQPLPKPFILPEVPLISVQPCQGFPNLFMSSYNLCRNLKKTFTDRMESPHGLHWKAHTSGTAYTCRLHKWVASTVKIQSIKYWKSEIQLYVHVILLINQFRCFSNQDLTCQRSTLKCKGLFKHRYLLNSSKIWYKEQISYLTLHNYWRRI